MVFQTYVFMGSLCETRNVWPLKAGLAHDPPIKFYENFVYCVFGGGGTFIIFTKGSVTPRRLKTTAVHLAR